MELQTALNNLKDNYQYTSTMFFYGKVNDNVTDSLAYDINDVVELLNFDDYEWWLSYTDENNIDIGYLNDFSYDADETNLFEDDMVIQTGVLDESLSKMVVANIVDHYEYNKPTYLPTITIAEDLLKHFNVA